VVGEGLVVLGVERAGGGEHDGGVQVGDDAGHRAACCDAGLRALVGGLQGREHQRHLRTHTHTRTSRLMSHTGVRISLGLRQRVHFKYHDH